MWTTAGYSSGGPCYEKLWCDPVSREMSKCFSGGKASLISMGMSWVSFAQLYVDWMLTLKRPGVAKVSGKWYDGSMPRILAESFSFPTRSKWFRLLYQQWSKDIHVRCATARMRPSSAMLACHVGCTALPVRRDRLSAVEAWLGWCWGWEQDLVFLQRGKFHHFGPKSCAALVQPAARRGKWKIFVIFSPTEMIQLTDIFQTG